MFTSNFWKRGLIALAALTSMALALAKGSYHEPKSSLLVERPLLVGAPTTVSSILQRACGDCHSENTVWPWYASLPPVSRQIHSDITRGRAFLNFSKWSEYSDNQRRGYVLAILTATQARVMPPRKYVWMHGDAKLSDAELKVLKEWALTEAKRVPHSAK